MAARWLHADRWPPDDLPPTARTLRPIVIQEASDRSQMKAAKQGSSLADLEAVTAYCKCSFMIEMSHTANRRKMDYLAANQKYLE